MLDVPSQMRSCPASTSRAACATGDSSKVGRGTMLCSGPWWVVSHVHLADASTRNARETSYQVVRRLAAATDSSDQPLRVLARLATELGTDVHELALKESAARRTTRDCENDTPLDLSAVRLLHVPLKGHASTQRLSVRDRQLTSPMLTTSPSHSSCASAVQITERSSIAASRETPAGLVSDDDLDLVSRALCSARACIACSLAHRYCRVGPAASAPRRNGGARRPVAFRWAFVTETRGHHVTVNIQEQPLVLPQLGQA